jgi:hypothetical protein
MPKVLRHGGGWSYQVGTGNRAELFQRGAGLSRSRRTADKEIQIPLYATPAEGLKLLLILELWREIAHHFFKLVALILVQDL